MNIDKAKTYKTRDGRAVRIYATDGGGVFPVHGAILGRPSDAWEPVSWGPDGNFASPASLSDLVEVVPEHTRWVVITPLSGYETQKGAQRGAKAAMEGLRVAAAVVKVTFREGEGLDSEQCRIQTAQCLEREKKTRETEG